MVKLIKADLRKDRSVLLIFLLIIILSTLLMHTGLMASGYKELYESKRKDNGVCDYLVFTTEQGNSADEWFANTSHAKSWQRSDVVLLNSLEITSEKFSGSKSCSDWIFERYGDENGYSQLRFIERDDSVSGNKIYLDIYSAYSNGLSPGDRFCADTKFGKYEFTVAGIYEHLFMGSSYTYQSVMVYPDIFDELKRLRDEADSSGTDITWHNMYTVRIKDGYEAKSSLKETKDAISGEYGLFCDGYTVDDSEVSYTAVVNILAAFMGAFAVVIVVICLIIIVFTINNNISRDVRNIGALKAVGHTVGQIRAALTAEYVLLGFIGSAAGIALSYALYPGLEYLYIREITGLEWENRFFPGITFGVLSGMLAVIVVTAFLSTIKIRTLHPATALRFGLQPNSFRKNHLPLSGTKGELNFLLAIKSTLQSKAQNIIIFFIIFSVSFVTMFSGVLYYNTKVDITSFQRMIQGDVPDGNFYVSDTSAEAVSRTIEKLETIDGISHAYGLSVTYGYIGDKETDIIYTNDPASLTCLIYDGQMLREENEAVLGSVLADDIGAGVGDEVEVSYGGKSKRFLVTGLQQSAVNNRIYVHENAAKELGVPVVYDYIRVKIDDADNEKVDEILRQGKELCGSDITGVDNYFRFQHSEENTPVFAVGLVVLILVFLNITTILLVIRLLLKTVFVKREKEFGIKKAVGFTSTQLRYQLSLSLLPTTLTASVCGSAAGYFGIDPMFALVLSGYGIKSSDLIIKPELMILPVIAVTILVFGFSFIMSGKMKKLSAYKLIQE